MRWMRRGRILRIRPGHLANFSGGAGYMPCTIIFSAPLSLLLQLITSISLHARARSLEAEDSEGKLPPIGLHEFAHSARIHLVIGAIVAFVATMILFLRGQQLVYSSTEQYALACLIISAGPFVLWLALARVHILLIARYGPHVWFIVVVLVVQLIGLFGVYVLGVRQT